MASNDQPSVQPTTEDEHDQPSTREQVGLTFEEFARVPFDKLLDIGFLIFISHKLEELFQEVLADVIIWCPRYLHHIAKKYKFWMQGENKHMDVDLDKPYHPSTVEILSLIRSLETKDDQWWFDSISDKRSAFEEYQNLFDSSQGSQSPPAGIKWIKRYEINRILERFKITLGQLCHEILQCKSDLQKTRNRQVRFQDVTEDCKSSAKTWLSALNTVTSELEKLDNPNAQEETSEEEALRTQSSPLFLIAKLRNETSHHGHKRPCLFSGDDEQKKMEKQNVKTFYESIVSCNELLDVTGANELKRADYRFVSEWGPLLEKYTSVSEELRIEISYWEGEKSAVDVKVKDLKEELKSVKNEMDATWKKLREEEKNRKRLEERLQKSEDANKVLQTKYDILERKYHVALAEAKANRVNAPDDQMKPQIIPKGKTQNK